LVSSVRKEKKHRTQGGRHFKTNRNWGKQSTVVSRYQDVLGRGSAKKRSNWPSNNRSPIEGGTKKKENLVTKKASRKKRRNSTQWPKGSSLITHPRQFMFPESNLEQDKRKKREVVRRGKEPDPRAKAEKGSAGRSPKKP